MAGRSYRDSWDIQRAYKEGFQKVTWVSRCIDAIAGNQARLPAILRKDNSPDGEILKQRNNEILKILNTKANEGENSFIFRYRVSSQLLMSSRGVFIEKIRSRSGKLLALNLLPPEYTAPIPDAKKFVSGFEVQMPTGGKIVLPPSDVLWIRRPHPLDPYLSLTPMESAGIAIEIENLAKLYNRNFLLNDGRPGGLLVLRSEIDEDDKDELRSRFRGNINRAGAITVISSDDGADYIDTSSSPRDANYVEMRQLQKEEILAAFGVPESVIGNAAGRTFSNAAEELRVFWMETMMPHLEQIARAMDELDDRYYVDFDTGNIPILIIAKQERERYSMEEFGNGLISMNEYREATGRKTVESDLADSLLLNPNLAPVANTEKPFQAEQVQPVNMGTAPPGGEGMPGAPGMPGEVPPGGAPPAGPPGLPMLGQETPPPEGAAPAEEERVVGAPTPVGEPGPTDQIAPGASPGQAIEQIAPPAAPDEDEEEEEETTAVPGQLSARHGRFETKTISSVNIIETQTIDEYDVKAEQVTDRWTEILDRSLERYIERQQRVIQEKASGAKTKKLMKSKELKVEDIFDIETWNRQLAEDLAPVYMAIAAEAAEILSKSAQEEEIDTSTDEYKEYVQQQVERTQKINETTKEEIAAAIAVALALMLSGESSDDDSAWMSLLKTAIIAIFVKLLGKRRRIIAEHEAQTAFNAGTYLAGKQLNLPRKTWLTKRDSAVREEHVRLHGRSVPIGSGFAAGDAVLRFPGDPLAPPHLTVNCRCRLKFRR
jgi:HK97 family phage portal protein